MISKFGYYWKNSQFIRLKGLVKVVLHFLLIKYSQSNIPVKFKAFQPRPHIWKYLYHFINCLIHSLLNLFIVSVWTFIEIVAIKVLRYLKFWGGNIGEKCVGNFFVTYFKVEKKWKRGWRKLCNFFRFLFFFFLTPFRWFFLVNIKSRILMNFASVVISLFFSCHLNSLL